MKNPYAGGFYALLVAIFTICGAVFWATWNSGKPTSAQDAFAFINSISALFQALAAGVVAVLAYKGLTSWKQELFQGKAIAVLWDANLAFSTVEASILRLGKRWSLSAPARDSVIVQKELQDDPIAKQLENFREQCLILDRVVVKNGDLWVTRADDLAYLIGKLGVNVHKAPFDPENGILSFLTSRIEANVAQNAQEIDSLLGLIKGDLQRLDKKYSL